MTNELDFGSHIIEAHAIPQTTDSCRIIWFVDAVEIRNGHRALKNVRQFGTEAEAVAWVKRRKGM